MRLRADPMNYKATSSKPETSLEVTVPSPALEQKILIAAFSLLLLLSVGLGSCRKDKEIPHSVEIRWDVPAQPATYYEVFKSTEKGAYDSKPYAPRLEGTTFTDNNVSSGMTYYYRVRAVREGSKGVLKSKFSKEVTVAIAKP